MRKGCVLIAAPGKIKSEGHATWLQQALSQGSGLAYRHQ
jgi:hypothetical protein